MDIFHNFTVERNGVVYCACGWNYVPSDEDDQRNHSAHHANFERITTARGHVPWPFSVRERMKDVAREALRVAVTDAEVFAASELLIRGWFDRSFAAAIERGFGDLHPSLPEYAKMLADFPQLDGRVGEVIAAVYRDVPRPPGEILSSYWEPAPPDVTPADSPATFN